MFTRMAFCSRCGRFTDEHYAYCLSCGAPMPNSAGTTHGTKSNDNIIWILLLLLIGLPVLTMVMAAVLYVLVMGSFHLP